MSATHRFLIVLASAGMALATASRAAFMQSGTVQAASGPSAAYTVPIRTTQLSPIVVSGRRINIATSWFAGW